MLNKHKLSFRFILDLMTRKQIIDPVEIREQQFLKGRHAGVKLIRLDICSLGITCYSTKGCDKCRVHCILKKKIRYTS